MITNPKTFFEQMLNYLEESALQLKAVIDNFALYLKTSDAENTYLSKTDASNTYATKTDVKDEVKATADAKLDKSTYTADKATFATKADTYTKSEVDDKVSSVYKYKGEVATLADLPTSGNTFGDVYSVTETGESYLWNGTKWAALNGDVNVDLTPYLTKDEASKTYATSETVENHTDNQSNPHGVTKAQVGLGNVTNESKAVMFTSPAFTGTPTAPTASAGTNTTQVATTAFVKAAVDAKTSVANATNAINATNATNATNAVTAQSATNDSEGNEIAKTYLKQATADALYLGKTAKAESAKVADTATKAIQDGDGKNIATTYATVASLNTTNTNVKTAQTTANDAKTLAEAALPKSAITIGDTDLEAGVSALPTGSVHFVYE